MAVENTTDDENATGADGGEAAEPTLLDSINEALAPTLPESDDTGETNTDEGEGDEESEDELDAEGDGAEGEEEGDEGSGEGDQPRGKDGKFAKTEADGKGEAAKGAEKGDGKQPDVVNDPIPEEIKGRTRERMQGLIDTVKSKDEIITNQHTVLAAVQQTGASAEEFAAMISYMGWAHSDKKEDLVQARDMLLHELEGVSLKLGAAAPGVDFISKYQDIKTQLEAGQITPEAAQELALARAKTEADAARTAAAEKKGEQSKEQEAAQRTAAVNGLNELGATLSEHDPDFDEKMKLVGPLDQLGKKYPPSQWRGVFQAAYKAAGGVLAKQRATAAGSKGTRQNTPNANGGTKQQPMRGNKAPSGGQQRQPSSLLDVVNAAIEEADQR